MFMLPIQNMGTVSISLCHKEDLDMLHLPKRTRNQMLLQKRAQKHPLVQKKTQQLLPLMKTFFISSWDFRVSSIYTRTRFSHSPYTQEVIKSSTEAHGSFSSSTDGDIPIDSHESCVSHCPKAMLSDILFQQSRILNAHILSKRDRNFPLVAEKGARL